MLNPPASYDRSLFARIADGDEQAFYTFYREHRPQLKQFALNFTKSASETEDILQETFMNIWLARDKMRDIENPKSWAYAVNTRVCMNWMRKQLRDRKKTEGLSASVAAGGELTETPFDALNLNEINKAIQYAVQAMPEQRKLIFTMSRDRGMKPAEIAEELGLSGGTVRNTLMMALRDIREQLASKGILTGLFLLYFQNIIFF